METYDPFNTIQIDFTGTRYQDAIVRCRLDMSYDEYEAVRDALFKPGDNGQVDPRAQYQVFAEKVLVEWNLIDPKTKASIKPDKSGVLKAPPPLVRHSIDAWANAFWDVDAPLGPR